MRSDRIESGRARPGPTPGRAPRHIFDFPRPLDVVGVAAAGLRDRVIAGAGSAAGFGVAGRPRRISAGAGAADFAGLLARVVVVVVVAAGLLARVVVVVAAGLLARVVVVVAAGLLARVVAGAGAADFAGLLDLAAAAGAGFLVVAIGCTPRGIGVLTGSTLPNLLSFAIPPGA